MATLLLSAAGAAAGAATGGTLMGMSMATVGRFAGATLGRSLDQRLLGQGADAVETARLERLRITSSGEGSSIARTWGRVRLGGHVIWASQFAEHMVTEGGGKGATSQPQVRKYSYSVSLAIGLCEGEIKGVSRVWVDGVEMSLRDFDMRIYHGSEDQVPDPRMEAVEGTGRVPAYRGLAYIVIEDLLLERFGNRVPQFSFEVVRAASDVAENIQAVALMPGSGEYILATTPVNFDLGAGDVRVSNVNTPSGLSDLETSLSALETDLPNCGKVSLIVSWFGDDLRCGSCQLRPMVEQNQQDGSMPWTVSGLNRASAKVVPSDQDKPLYGGTPADASVIEAIKAIHSSSREVMFYPFILMDQIAGNGKIDPWSGAVDQPVFPWRGRITGSAAPGRPNSPDGTAIADAEVASFFGSASAADFTVAAGRVVYTGPLEWSYRRFILHNAALCAAAGGVAAFCIGSEMRGLTHLRGLTGFPAVHQLRSLAAEVRGLLGVDTKIGYAADWSEYFGYHPQDGSGNVYFHLDSLWADDDIDFIGIDNYMPLSDWRDSQNHADAHWGNIANPEYLDANIEGGEGFDWYYASQSDRDAQIRSLILDGDHSEPWIYRYKDIRSWWQNAHHERIDGIRQSNATAWVPESKPIWFTELGCAAVDKGTNAPNLFVDPKSSESALPPYSSGGRDEGIQNAYLNAMHRYWANNSPISTIYQKSMVDMSHAFVWAWDARPYPWFPNAETLWSDGSNYARGHWISGRMSNTPVARLIEDICAEAGLYDVDTSRLSGLIRGYALDDVQDARQALQPLLVAHGLDAVERAGVLSFSQRSDAVLAKVDTSVLAEVSESDALVQQTRAPLAELPERVRVRFIEADGEHREIVEEATLQKSTFSGAAASELPLVLTRGEGRQLAERWLQDAQISRDTVRFALPLSYLHLGPGDLVDLELGTQSIIVRIDRVEIGTEIICDATRTDTSIYVPARFSDVPVSLPSITPAAPVFPLFLDLPLLTGDEDSHAPHVAVAARPWTGPVAIYSSAADSAYRLDETIERQSIIGVTQSEMHSASSATLDRGDPLRVRLTSGNLSSIDSEMLLAGGNTFAIGDGISDVWEIFQAGVATLVGTRTYDLSRRLRGRLGTDGVMPTLWPVGSYLVALNGVPEQLPMPSSSRGILRHYRIGPASQSYDHGSYIHQTNAFLGNGLRPYSVVHLRAKTVSENLHVSWIRRTRIDGDQWNALEVPLGEETEQYILRIERDGLLLREEILTTPLFVYSQEARAADGPHVVIKVAQLSTRFGSGPFSVLAA